LDSGLDNHADGTLDAARNDTTRWVCDTFFAQLNPGARAS